MDIIYFVDNKLGGVTSLNYNLASHALPGANQTVIHIDEKEWDMSRANIAFPVDKEIYFNFSGIENTYSIIRKLRKLIPETEGAMILNYEYEMVVLDRYSLPQTSYQLVHDHYNLRLAKKYGHVSDVFICHNTVIYKELLELFPERKSEVFYLPHGVTIPAQYRPEKKDIKPLQLLFLGRMAASKGIFDLPVINDFLRSKAVQFEWTCIGNGPELEALKLKWDPKDKVKFLSPSSNKDVLEICAKMDVFVLPTKFEGTPVSLLETMSAGLVPVITSLPGGITDIVNDEIGYRIPLNDLEGFANAIAELYQKPALLNTLSKNCRQKVIAEFDIVKTAKTYHDLFLRYKEFYKKKQHKKIKIGARLDHPFIYNGITKAIRNLIKKSS